MVASGLSYNSRMDNLLPENLSLVKEFNHVVDKTGGSGPLVLVLEGLHQNKAPQIINELTQRLKNLPGVHYVDSRIPKDYLNNRQLLLASRQDLLELESLMQEAVEFAREELGGFGLGTELFNPEKLQSFADDYNIFEDINPYYRGKSKRNYYVFVQPKGTVTNTAFTKDFVKRIREEIRRSGLEEKFSDLKIKLTGSLIVRLEENRTIVRDLKRSAVLAVVLTILLILFYTRSGFSIPLIVFPLLLSLSYTFALAKLVIGHINIVTGFLIAILLGLGIDYGIHFYIRFKQELVKGKTISAAVELVVTQVGRSAVVAMFTTISVFSILMFSDFRGFSQFGTIAAMGIACAFVTFIFIFPAQVLYYDKVHWLRKPRPRLFTLKIFQLYANTPYFLTALFFLLTISSLFLLSGVQFEYDFKKLRGESPAGDYETATTEDFGFAFSPTLILTPEKENLFFIHQVLADIKKQNGNTSTIGLHHSLNLFSKREYESKKDVLNRIRKLFEQEKGIIKLSLGEPRFLKLKQLIHSKPFDESQVPEILIKKFKVQGEYLLLILSPAEKDFFDIRNIYQLEKEIRSLKQRLEKIDLPTAIMNENLLAAKIMDWVRSEGPRAIATAMGLVFLILVIDMRSIRLALKTFLPLFSGLALTGALLSVFHFKLNFINFVMLPSIVGIMIDHCIYLAHHIQEYSQKSALTSLEETGSAIILSALTSLVGYGSLNVASHAGIQSIASLVQLGILTCTVCALFMLPALFELDMQKLIFYKSDRRKEPRD
ncbi:MAG: MMPL family transporter [Nitrospinota bacterium]|nr:MMPL family transporter [Nitrospinota bacterium]